MMEHIIPYFGNQMSEITAGRLSSGRMKCRQKDFRAYLRMIQNQLTSLFTHAHEFTIYTQPVKVKRMEARITEVWTSTVDEYQSSADDGAGE